MSNEIWNLKQSIRDVGIVHFAENVVRFFLSKLVGASSAASSHYILKDDEQNAGWTQSEFGLMCYDEWQDEYEDVVEYREVEGTDESGNAFVDVESFITGAKKLIRKAGSRYGIRYEEALILETALMRKTIDRIENKLYEIEIK